MTLYHLKPTEQTLHGSFSREHAPILTIASGDSVSFRTPDAGWGMEAPSLSGEERRRYPRREGAIDAGHALVGPVAIERAKPGMTLAVTIERLVPGSYGWTQSGGWDSVFHRHFGTTEGKHLLVWSLDRETGLARNQVGHAVTMRPFLGVMGMPPDEAGLLSTAPPRLCGGNLDCKELVVGTTLYLPIMVEGGLFSTGDGHAAQGDGEMCGTAIECPMEEAVLRFDLLEELTLTAPRARTASSWITLGVDEDLDRACYMAANGMIDLIMAQYDVGRKEALGLASVAVDLRITQIVNGVQGVHAVLADGAISHSSLP